jgi:hypothetical protein
MIAHAIEQEVPFVAEKENNGIDNQKDDGRENGREPLLFPAIYA